MLRQDVEQALSEITNTYDDEISKYIRKIIYSELRAHGEDPEDLISLSYIVLDRAKKLYNAEVGEFRNYAIRSLKNEFLKLKHRKELLYEDFVQEDQESSYQVQENDDALQFQKLPKDTIQKHFNDQAIKESAVAVIAVLQSQLTPFEKSLIYSMLYVTDDERKPSLREFSECYDISYSKLLTKLKHSLDKLRNVLVESKTKVHEIQELLQ